MCSQIPIRAQLSCRALCFSNSESLIKQRVKYRTVIAEKCTILHKIIDILSDPKQHNFPPAIEICDPCPEYYREGSAIADNIYSKVVNNEAYWFKFRTVTYGTVLFDRYLTHFYIFP